MIQSKYIPTIQQAELKLQTTEYDVILLILNGSEQFESAIELHKKHLNAFVLSTFHNKNKILP
jgi:hypothetical protein